jgi:heme-degrading monooxygenase HmoA
MYARVGTGQAQPGNIDDGARRIREIVVPVLKQQKGFKNLYILVDRETRKTYSIGFWESEADLKAFVESDTQAKMQAKMREAGGA